MSEPKVSDGAYTRSLPSWVGLHPTEEKKQRKRQAKWETIEGLRKSPRLLQSVIDTSM